MSWHYELENDTGWNDEGYWEWYEVYDENGTSIAKTNKEEHAKLIVQAPLIRDAAIDLLRWYLYAGASGITSSKFEKLKAAVGLTDEELRKGGE